MKVTLAYVPMCTYALLGTKSEMCISNYRHYKLTSSNSRKLNTFLLNVSYTQLKTAICPEKDNTSGGC